ncbi:hypothetical protein BDP27DRAFT_1437482 [Rhodocollybia butyracea]|uniref:Uncharacterized protein n=1 Tax=Rhodocollybia butyracea TaxID=206335 RepID=A0A9P5P445_9AGAR|nr:hypothetical protein BDP27DRAFT_1437482 [Rhodocollybia butyracea]
MAHILAKDLDAVSPGPIDTYFFNSFATHKPQIYTDWDMFAMNTTNRIGTAGDNAPWSLSLLARPVGEWTKPRCQWRFVW